MMPQDKVYFLRKKKKVSSQRWLMRHLNDSYVREAKRQGYRCRSAFKLLEIQDKFSLLKQGMHVLDLGCAPGSWCQVISAHVGGQSLILGVDKLFMEPLTQVSFIQKDIARLSAIDHPSLNKGFFHVITSDIAPSFTGQRVTDRAQMEALMDEIWDTAQKNLAPGGSFLMKAFCGYEPFMAHLRHHFTKVQYIKPPASSLESKELYILGNDFKETP